MEDRQGRRHPGLGLLIPEEPRVMPLYEYLCDSCGRKMEVIQRFSDLPLGTCDRCGGLLKKLMSASAVQFKGSGWYVSDYGRSGGKEKEKDAGSGKTAETGEKAAGPEAKPGTPEKPASKETDGGSGTKSKPTSAAPPSGAASPSKKSGSGH
jgi:putative FmdB family regulatory protein